MTVLQFTLPQHPSQGGIFISTKSFQETLGSKIVELVPSKLYGQTTGDYQVQLIDSGFFKLYPLPTNQNKVLSQLEKLSVDLVIIHGFWRVHNSLGYQFAKAHNIPYLLVTHGALDPYVFTYRSLPKQIWLSLIGQKIIREASAIICSTSEEYEKAKKYLKESQIEICHWGVEAPSQEELKQWRQETRRYLGISSEQRVLIFLGRLHKMKRPLETGLAFKKLNLKDWNLLIIGPKEKGGGVEEIETICDNKFIKYHSPVYGIDKWKLLAAGDAFVNLSHRENFGRSIVEAAAAGLPLLISDGVDIFPILQNSGCADVVTINSFNDISNALKEFLLKSPMEHQKMGIKAYQCFQSNFTKEIFQTQLVNITSKYTKANY